MQQIAATHFFPYLLAICAFCLYIIVNIFLKIIAQDFTPLYGIYGMNAGALLIQLAYMHYFGNGIRLDVKNPAGFKYLCYRTAFSTCSIMILLYNVSKIPVSMANTFHNLGPLFIYFVEAAYYHKKIQLEYLGLTFVSFIGVLMIIKPSFIFGNEIEDFENLAFYAVLGCVGALFASGASLLINEVKKYEINESIAKSYFYIFHIFSATFLINFNGYEMKHEFNTQMIADWVLLIILLVIAQYIMYKAYFLGDPVKILPFGYAGIITAVIIDFFYFHENMDIWDFMGIMLTSIGLIANFLKSKKQSEREKIQGRS